MTNKFSDSNSVFESARVSTIKSVMGATGWNVNILNEKEAVEDCFYFYVTSYPENWTWMCSVAKSTFFSMIEKFKKEEISDSAGRLGNVIQMGIEQNFKDISKSEWDSYLGASLTSYFSKTQAYKATENGTRGTHLFVIKYSKSGNLRPFAASGSERFPLSVDNVIGYVEKVIIGDMKNHPEWMN